jgi:beta-lactamase regulating signal transducer with metallopeptidase domain
MNTALDVADVVVKASIVLALAALWDLRRRRHGSAAARHFGWTVAIAALIVLPFASAWLPAWSIAVPVSEPVAVAASGVTTVLPPITTGALQETGSESARAAPLAATRRFDPLAFAFAIYSAGLVLLLARLVVEEVTVRRLAARARAVDDAEWLETAALGARQLGIRRDVRLLQSEENVMPFTFGTVRPAIVLPEAAARWAAGRRTAVILHELAHVARRDCLAQRLASIACALYWPHPGVWWAARRLRVEREFACDDRVLSAGAGPRDYAGHLLEIAHTFRANPAPATALGMARARQLEHRLLAIIEDGRNRAGLQRRTCVTMAALTAVLLLPMASLHAELAPQPDGLRTTAAQPAGASGLGGAASSPSRIDEPAAAASGFSGATSQKSDSLTADDYSGTWELHMSRRPGMVTVSLRTSHSQQGTTVPLSRFAGINEPGMTAAVRDGRIVDGNVHFASRRDAGTFTFDGVCRNEMCGGTFTFAPDATFASRLAKYGLSAPTAREQYQLAMADAGVAYVEGLEAEGYTVPDLHTLVRAAQHGVSLDYVKSMTALGYKVDTVETLIKLRDHGVDPEYVKAMAAQGFKKLDAEALVRLRDHGVDPEYVKGMRDLGYDSADVADFVKARDHGVDPTFARGLMSLGYKSVSLDELIRMRDHGVGPDYVRGFADAGYKNVSIDTLVRLRDHGVDPEYARGLAGLGYRDVPAESLIRLRDHGVDLSYIRRVQQRGGERASIEDLIRRRDRGDDGR